MKLYPPRNAQNLPKLEPGAQIIVSFIGDTPLRLPTVYCDSGRRYDWAFARGLHVTIVVKAGIDARQTIADLFALTVPYPNLVDYDKQLLASIVDAPGGVKLWPRRKGSEPWQSVFG